MGIGFVSELNVKIGFCDIFVLHNGAGSGTGAGRMKFKFLNINLGFGNKSDATVDVPLEGAIVNGHLCPIFIMCIVLSVFWLLLLQVCLLCIGIF